MLYTPNTPLPYPRLSNITSDPPSPSSSIVYFNLPSFSLYNLSGLIYRSSCKWHKGLIESCLLWSISDRRMCLFATAAIHHVLKSWNLPFVYKYSGRICTEILSVSVNKIKSRRKSHFVISLFRPRFLESENAMMLLFLLFLFFLNVGFRMSFTEMSFLQSSLNEWMHITIGKNNKKLNEITTTTHST